MTAFGISTALGMVILLVLVAALVSKSGRRYKILAEIQRKLVHIPVGLCTIILPFLLNRSEFCIFAVSALLALLALRIPSIQKSISHSVHAVKRTSWGDILILVSVSFLFLMAPGDPLFYILPLAVIAVSDSIAAIVGTQYGRHKFGSGDRQKSIEGTASFFVTTWIIALGILALTPSMPRGSIVELAIFIAVLSTLIEAVCWQGFDNLLVPLGIFAFFSFDPVNAPLTQLLVVVYFIFILLVAGKVAPLVNMKRHSFIVIAIGLFIVTGLSGFIATLFSFIALISQSVFNKNAQDSDKNNLEFVVIMTLLAAFWQVVGTLTNTDGTRFFIITFCALSAGFMALFFFIKLPTHRFLIALIIGSIFWLLANFSISSENIWNGAFFTFYGASISAVTIFGTLIVIMLGGLKYDQFSYKIATVATVFCFSGFIVSLCNIASGGQWVDPHTVHNKGLVQLGEKLC